MRGHRLRPLRHALVPHRRPRDPLRHRHARDVRARRDAHVRRLRGARADVRRRHCQGHGAPHHEGQHGGVTQGVLLHDRWPPPEPVVVGGLGHDAQGGARRGFPVHLARPAAHLHRHVVHRDCDLHLQLPAPVPGQARWVPGAPVARRDLRDLQPRPPVRRVRARQPAVHRRRHRHLCDERARDPLLHCRDHLRCAPRGARDAARHGQGRARADGARRRRRGAVDRGDRREDRGDAEGVCRSEDGDRRRQRALPPHVERDSRD
mmetsp:Transcript_21416/g.66441  ORF Transcript_21416/g.66441 Transcript_21416/m.66441 type:complete len:263 (-) Transcript_21416:1002-1790(-)